MTITEGEVTFEGMKVHFWEGGSGFPVLMLHGSGPGASTLGNWRLVLEPLAERYHVVAADLIGFGLSDRKPQPPYFDLDLWQRQGRFLLDRFGAAELGVVGHSISGALALKLAAEDRRIRKVLTTGSMGVNFRPNPYTEMVWTFPETREDLKRTAECLIYDKSAITEAYLDNRMQVLHANDYASYFRSMFQGDKQRYIEAAALSEAEIAAIACEVMMVHGRDDQPFPYEENSLALSRRLPQADVLALSRCSHSPALEHPEKLLAAAKLLFG